MGNMSAMFDKEYVGQKDDGSGSVFDPFCQLFVSPTMLQQSTAKSVE